MVAFVGKERRDTGSRARSIVVGKFRKRKERESVVLLVIAEYPEVLFQCLFRLSVTFGMVSRGEVKLETNSELQSEVTCSELHASKIHGSRIVQQDLRRCNGLLSE